MHSIPLPPRILAWNYARCQHTPLPNAELVPEDQAVSAPHLPVPGGRLPALWRCSAVARAPELRIGSSDGGAELGAACGRTIDPTESCAKCTKRLGVLML